jgi:uncharacterized protein
VSSNRVVIFSKSADDQTVKTRMKPALNSQQCLALHLALLRDTLAKVREFSPVLYLTPPQHLPFIPSIPIRKQEGADLGERLLNAFRFELESFKRVVIIGIDSPTFPPDVITTAFQALEQHDVALGPSEDGGYYLIGLRKLRPEIFRDIPWGTSEVFKATIKKAKNYFLLDPYFDVDVPADLERLRSELITNDAPYLQNTREWIARFSRR